MDNGTDTGKLNPPVETPQEIETPTETPKVPAPQLLQSFLDENNLTLEMTDFSFKHIDDGSLVVVKPELIVRYKD